MSEPPPTERSIAAKLLTICAVGVLISLGMCAMATQMVGGWDGAQAFVGIAGALVFICSLLGCLVLLVIIGIGALRKKL